MRAKVGKCRQLKQVQIWPDKVKFIDSQKNFLGFSFATFMKNPDTNYHAFIED